MIVEVSSKITFRLDTRRPAHLDYNLHTFTIWEEGGGYVELTLTDEELEQLRGVIG